MLRGPAQYLAFWFAKSVVRSAFRDTHIMAACAGPEAAGEEQGAEAGVTLFRLHFQPSLQTV